MNAPLSTLADDELRGIAALAHACLLIESARAYGFITGGPEVDEDRCDEVLGYARERGVVPSQDDVDTAIAGLIAEVGTRA